MAVVRIEFGLVQLVRANAPGHSGFSAAKKGPFDQLLR
jgi:hypothetical protein